MRVCAAIQTVTFKPVLLFVFFSWLVCSLGTNFTINAKNETTAARHFHLDEIIKTFTSKLDVEKRERRRKKHIHTHANDKTQETNLDPLDRALTD